MSTPEAETLEREKDKLWVTDAELIRRMGVPEKTAREALRMLDAQRSGFPQKQKVWGVGGIGRPSRPILTGSTGVRSLNLNAWSEHEADL